MDMAFVNAANASTSFPPHDPWMSGEELNYYYLGHLAMAIVIKVVGTAPDEGYNLAFALLAALSATAVFTFAGTLWAAARPRLTGVRGGPVLVGVTAVVVCIVLGNLAGAREWLDAADPPGDYDWFAPSRVIEGTINEFPWFSFLLGDLHAHVLALPFTVVALAFALQVAIAGPRGDAVLRGVAEALAAGLAVGVLYAVNSWSYPIAAGMLVGAVVMWLRDPRSAGRRGYAVSWLVLVLLASVVLVLPFWLNFDPAASGIALVEERAPFGALHGRPRPAVRHLRGLLVAVFAARVLAARRPAAHAGLGRGRPDLRRLAAGRRRPRGRRRARGAARRGHRRRALAHARRPRALPVAARERRPRLRDRARAGLRARRVRRQRPVPHEHRLQARLPRLAAAGAGRRVRAAVGGRAPAAARMAGVGGRRGGAAAARARLPLRGDVRAQGRLLALTLARRPGLAAPDRPGRSGRHRLAAREHGRRGGGARGGGGRLLGLRPRPHLDLHRPPDRARLGRARAAVGPRARRAARRTSAPSTRPTTSRRRAS